MHTLGAVLLVLALQPVAAAAPQGDGAPDVVAPAAHAQNIEAFAAPDIRKSAPTAIVALNARQLKDPHFHAIANRLGDALQRQGFNLVDRGQAFQNAVTFEYRVNRDTDGDLPGQSTSDPRVVKQLGLAAFPVYRRLTVTAYALNDRKHVRLLWRTVMAEDGFDPAVDRTIPPLVEAGQQYFGRSLTALAVADCGTAPQLGTRIGSEPCGDVRARLGGDVVRRPQVTVGPLSTPSPSVAAPPGR